MSLILLDKLKLNLVKVVFIACFDCVILALVVIKRSGQEKFMGGTEEATILI